MGDQPPVEHVDHADDHDHLEHVDHDGERRPEQLIVAEDGKAPARVERPAEQLDDLEHQDDEPPEDQRVHDPRRLVAAQELLLAEPVHDRSLEALRQAVEAGRRPRAEQQPRPQADDHGEHEHGDRPDDRKRDMAHDVSTSRLRARSVADGGSALIGSLSPRRCGELRAAAGEEGAVLAPEDGRGRVAGVVLGGDRAPVGSGAERRRAAQRTWSSMRRSSSVGGGIRMRRIAAKYGERGG